MNKERGLIGMLVRDRDEKNISQVFECLSDSLRSLSKKIEVDMLVCLRPSDHIVRKQCIAFQPLRISTFNTLEICYDEILKFNTWDIPEEIVCQTRNLIREHALKNDYNWLFLLNSDICVSKSTLSLLLESKKEVIGAPYTYNGFPHPAIPVLCEGDGPKKEMILLLNPHLYKTKDNVIPCLAIDLGAALIRYNQLNIPITLDEYKDVLQGGADGFSKTLLYKGSQPYCLARHLVRKISSPSKKLIFPFIDDKMPMFVTRESFQKWKWQL